MNKGYWGKMQFRYPTSCPKMELVNTNNIVGTWMYSRLQEICPLEKSGVNILSLNANLDQRVDYCGGGEGGNYLIKF